MNTYFNIYAKSIFELLSPIIGELMAKGAIRSQCNKLGISEEMIQKKDMATISEGIGKAMMLFIGTEGAKQLVEKIKKI